MKKKLADTLGVFGVILYYIISTVAYVLPFVMIGAPFWLDIIFILVQEFLPITSIVFWIWGLVRTILGPQDIWAIIYYVLFGIMYIPFFINLILVFFQKDE